MTTRTKGGSIHRFLGLAVLVLTVALTFAGAAAAATPSAITGPVTSVGPTTATATGTVNPNGQATTWYVEYGTSTSYGSKTANVSAGSGTANAAVSASLHRSHGRHDLPLPGGGDKQFRNGPRRRRNLHHVRGAGRGYRIGDERDDDHRDAQRHRRSERPRDHVVLRIRDEHELRLEDGREERRLGHEHDGCRRAGSGLTRGRLYHYRLVATSDAGTSRGADQTFSTITAPAAVTGAASSIGLTSAKLNGTVTPNGQATSWYFEYGTSTSYGTKTSAKSAGSGTSAVKVAASLTGLRRTTTYHYRLVASNASGTTVGGDRTFSTALPPSVRTGAAQDVAATTATLTGAVDRRGRSTNWYFEYGTSTSYGARTPNRGVPSGAGARNVTAPLTRLTPGTTYHYRLVATSDAGTGRGVDATFTTVGVTLSTPALLVVYGRGLTLSGSVPVKRAGETVTIFAQPFGEGSFRSIATVLTAPDGTWRYVTRPRIRTSYLASWNGGRSGSTEVGVRPAVSLRRTAAGLLSTRVTGAHTFAGRRVQLQRRTAAGNG